MIRHAVRRAASLALAASLSATALPAAATALPAATRLSAAAGSPPTAAASPLPSLPASAVPLDLGAIRLTLEPFTDGLASPVFVTGDRSGTGRLLVVEQGGRILAITPGGRIEPEPILELSHRITAGGEQGLLGLALHPDFPENGRFFVDYTRAEDGATVIAEFTIGEDGTANATQERQLLVIPQPYPNHNGGMIAFDADGMLLVGMGDGGSGGDPDGYGQDPDALLGKMLRLDVEADPYAIPADNPFAGGTSPAPEILALGLRNPWRFSVDRATGDLWIGDVGQGALEEVDVLPAGTGGANLGWNVMEGDACFDAAACDASGLTLPVATISHDDSACSVIGGYVYRGTAIPALAGAYLYTDLCIGTLWALDAAAAITAGAADPVAVGQGSGQLVSFGEGDDGELYLVDLAGAVLRVVADPEAAG